MKIPDNIKIGGFNIDVEFVDNLIIERGSLGEYHPRTQTIRIDKDNSNQQKEETFIHEVLEAIISIYDIEIEHKDLSIMATVLHQILLDNKKILKE